MSVQDLLNIVVKAANDKKAEDIVVLNLQGLSFVADYFVICHGNTDKQVQAIVREIDEKVSEAGFIVKNREGLTDARWVLVDLGDIIVHVFHRDERYYYNLEKLWGDAPVVDLESGLAQ